MLIIICVMSIVLLVVLASTIFVLEQSFIEEEKQIGSNFDGDLL